MLESRYRIEVEVGRGGMGVVYRGTDLTLKRPVAIKALRQSDGDQNVLGRFLREARSLARVEHPGLVPVYAVGREDGVYYMVMKFVEGRTLQQLLRERGPMEPFQVRRVVREVCDALTVLHQAGLIHRDLKPGNLILTPEGRVMVMDLGIVKAVGEDTQTTSTALGTPKYMAPEMLESQTVDGRADLYSLGVVAYELLCGDPPFDGPTPMAILFKQAHEAPEPLKRRVPSAPKNLASAIERALEKRPDDRFADARTFAESVREEAAASALPKSKERRLALRLSLAVLVVAALVALTFRLMGSSRPEASESKLLPVIIAVASATSVPAPVSEVRTPSSGPNAGVSPASSTAPAPTVKLVNLVLTSDPAGAAVFEGGRLVGRTPLTLKRPQSARMGLFVLKLDGYTNGKITTNLGADARGHAKLDVLFELVP